MPHTDSDHPTGMNRREFVQVTSAAAAGTALLGMLPKGTEAVEKYPHWGEVLVVRNSAATDGPAVRAEEIRVMVDGALRRFTDTSSVTDAWGSLLPGWQEDHRVAIKVSSIGERWRIRRWRMRLPGAWWSSGYRRTTSSSTIVCWAMDWPRAGTPSTPDPRGYDASSTGRQVGGMTMITP